MSFSADRVFPVRLLGFGLYWTWLFLVTVSPSPIFSAVQLFSLPTELFELTFRLVFVFVIFGFASRLESPFGRNFLVFIACVAGPAATYLEYLFPGGTPLIFAIILEGLTDASVFVLWLCFFGNMRVGETALYMTLSYLIGGLLCIAIQLVSGDLLILISMALPAASGLMFHFSNKMYAAQHEAAELFDLKESEDEQELQPFPYLTRLGIALGCTAFVFGTCSCCIFFGETHSMVSGVTIESVCCLILGVVCLVFMKITKQTQDLCSLYKVVAALIVLGIVLLRFPEEIISTAGVGCITFGYLMLEITALNDFCIAAKARGLSLIKTFCGARIAITGGLIAGWVIYLLLVYSGVEYPVEILFGFALVVIATTYTIIFTEKEIFSAHNVAEVQERIERAENTREGDPTKFESRFEEFANHYKLSTREQEIAAQLIRGRNINYIADELFIAPGTVKTHVHNIYTKVGVHNKMELLDVFENKEA